MSAQELATIAPTNALHVFTTPDAIDPLLKKVREQIDAFKPDVSTLRGRKEVASFAYRIAQTKTAMEAVGKALADEQKEIPKKIDASRKLVRETLDAWRDEVRKPLTDWEESEESRVDRHRQTIAHVAAMAQHMHGRPASELRACLEAVERTAIGPECEEFEAEYARTKDCSATALRAAIVDRDRYESEQAELVRLRKEAEERAARDRDEQIAREAADRARREAEEAAASEQRRIEAAARAEREAADRREADLKREAEDAERRAAEAVEAERRRAAAEAARVAEEARRREEDRAHRGRINTKAVAAFVKGGLTEEQARLAVTLIASREVPNVSIAY